MANRKPGWTLIAGAGELLRELGAKSPRVRRALRVAAESFRGDWVEELSQPGSGRTYEAGLRFITKGARVIPIRDRSGVKRTRADHRASAPGESPAKDSGVSASSIAVDDTDADKLRVGSNRESLLYLHYGVTNHPGGITIAPRPHATRAFERARPRMIDLVRRELARGE